MIGSVSKGYTKSKMRCAAYQREDGNCSQGDDRVDQPHDSGYKVGYDWIGYGRRSLEKEEE